jgi:hypothetical protein
MRHPVTDETKDLLEALDHIRERVQPRLDSVSTEAREEWVKLLLRFPADEDVGLGLIDLSPEALAQMIAKASRFEQIVRTARSSAPVGAQQAGVRAPRYADEPMN